MILPHNTIIISTLGMPPLPSSIVLWQSISCVTLHVVEVGVRRLVVVFTTSI